MGLPVEFIVIITTIALSGVGFAALSIGTDCRRTLIANCRRLNGTLSNNRIRREFEAFSSYMAALALPLMLALPLAVLVVSTIDRQIMPIQMVADAFSRFSPNAATWKEELKDVREDHSQWLAQTGVADGADIQQLQKELWYGWPTIAAAVCCFVMLSLWFFLGLAKAAVTDFASGVRLRRKTYAKLDVAQMVGPVEQSV